MANPELSPATAARLRTLRLRITALIALLATVAVTVFAVVVIRIDRQLRDEQAETELLRIVDEAARAVRFEEGVLQPDAPAIDRTIVAVTPSFSADEFAERQEELGLPEPQPDQLADLVREVFEEADLFDQASMIGQWFDERGLGAVADDIDYAELFDNGATVAGPVEVEDEDGEDGFRTFEETELFLDDLVDELVGDPPQDLGDEAYRRFVERAADDAGVELEFETTYFATDANPLGEDVMFTIADTVAETPGEPFVDSVVDDDGVALDVRATPLRDGPEVRGALIAVLDPAEFDDAHADLRNQVILLALAIVAGSVVAAWFVAARSITPTARALAQQERFLADAAHELRTPIAAIRLTAESAQPDTATDNLTRVAELAADASTLTDDLLTLARMDADRMELQRENVRLDLLVESTIAAIPGAVEATLVAGDTPVVDADPRLVERAVGNLVRNAMAHGRADPTTPARIDIASAHGTATVTVRDHGPGIEADVADELFERFRSRTGSKGHGLGLALARWIARAHGGDLAVAPAPPDGGAVFVLTLPAEG
ncbi:MAG: HAMP domain-containing sensor histidine kinase [Actinomycetota bacterium]